MKDGERLFANICSERTRGRVRLLGETLYCDGGKPIEQVAQRICGHPITRTVQSQVGWCSE